MKKPLLLLTLLLTCYSLQAQMTSTETTIRALEQKEVNAVVVKDTAALSKMWSKDFTVNNPFNKIVKAGKTTVDRPVINDLNYTSFERNIEHVMIKGDVAITMGNELVVEKGEGGKTGRTIKRRYTHIWMQEGNEWKMTARHANEICITK